MASLHACGFLDGMLNFIDGARSKEAKRYNDAVSKFPQMAIDVVQWNRHVTRYRKNLET